MKIPRIFIGYDKRIPLAYNVLQHSIVRHASGPVSITPLILSTLKQFDRTGLTEFTFSRYLVPWLCDYEGMALFLDSDMVVQDDIYKLFDVAEDNAHAVYVVKSKHRFEWPSVMLFNCKQCTKLNPAYITEGKPQTFEWASSIGELHSKWNHLVGYDKPDEDPHLIHYTMGIPAFLECREHEHAGKWRDEHVAALKMPSWLELMGTSVHFKKVLRGLNFTVPKPAQSPVEQQHDEEYSGAD